MTIGGAISELNNLLKADDIPIYYKPSIKVVMDTIMLSSSENLNRWIPVSEKLPPDDEDVLVQYEQGVMEVVYYQTYHNLNETGWFSENGDVLYFEPVAWMPLPKSYNSQESE